jgi:uncharacterized repeat protein (TIGR01451 family)
VYPHTPVRNRSPQELGPVRAVDSGHAAAGPVAQAGVGARLESKGSEETIDWNEPRSDVEVATERRLGPRLAHGNDSPQEQLAVANPPHFEPSGPAVDDDPVSDGPNVDQAGTHPAALAVRAAGQAQLVPPKTVSVLPGPEREHDLDLQVGTELPHRSKPLRSRIRRRPDRCLVLRQLAGRRKGVRKVHHSTRNRLWAGQESGGERRETRAPNPLPADGDEDTDDAIHGTGGAGRGLLRRAGQAVASPSSGGRAGGRSPLSVLAMLRGRGILRPVLLSRRRVRLVAFGLLGLSLAAVAPIVLGGPVPGVPPTGDEKKVRICHATSSESNPYVEEEPAIMNNGDLSGGHLNHTGPVFPQDGWGDIIPPYTYVDGNGELRVFPGYNWSPEGQAIYSNGCVPPPPPEPPDPAPLTPIVECVEGLAGGGFLAHFGYENPNSATIQPPVEQNAFSPPPEARGQRQTFAPGRVEDSFQVESGGEALTWSLTGNQATASLDSPRCEGSITIIKALTPAGDRGRFDLEIDGQIVGGAAAVGDGGTTGTIAVTADEHTVGESGAKGTDLGEYHVEIVCRTGGGAGDVVAQGTGASVRVGVRRNEAIVCTITNEGEHHPEVVRPVLECVVFNEGEPDLAVWGYQNDNHYPMQIPIGSENGFAPTPQNRGQPETFEEGRLVGVFETPFEAGAAASLVWTLSGETVTASGESRRCTASVELRKVVEPASDPGVFNLLINGEVLATGGNGTTTGPLTVGIGEGTASETAAAGTSLADYESSIECTRNGEVVVSVSGTKIDGAVGDGDMVVCTFTNRRLSTPPTPPTPITPPPSPPTLTPESPPPSPPPSPGPVRPRPEPDLVVTKTADPPTVVRGGLVTWTVTVTNNSTVEATDVNAVKVDDPRSFRSQLVSLTSSQGTCGIDPARRTGGCDFGRLPPGGSATVTVVTRNKLLGEVVNIVRVSSEEIESDYLNNTASALIRVIGEFRPRRGLGECRSLTVLQRALQAGRTSVVLVTARNRLGQPLRGVTIRARGAGLNLRARTNPDGVARIVLTPRSVGILALQGVGSRATAGTPRPRCRTLVGVLPARQTPLTG